MTPSSPKYTPWQQIKESDELDTVIRPSPRGIKRRRNVHQPRKIMTSITQQSSKDAGETKVLEKKKKKNKSKSKKNKTKKIRYFTNISVKFPKARRKTRNKQKGGKKIKLTKLSPLENIILRRIRKTRKSKRSL